MSAAWVKFFVIHSIEDDHNLFFQDAVSLDHLTFTLLTDSDDAPASRGDLASFNRQRQTMVGAHAVPQRFPTPVPLHFFNERLVGSTAAAKQILLDQSIEAQDDVAIRAADRQGSENAEAQQTPGSRP